MKVQLDIYVLLVNARIEIIYKITLTKIEKRTITQKRKNEQKIFRDPFLIFPTLNHIP